MQMHEYLNWRDSAKMSEHYGFFWIKSKPGAGKSTLMKFFFKSAKERLPDDNVISFFFNARGEALEKSLEGLYRSLIYQLLTQIPRLQHHLRTARNGTPRPQNWSLESLKSIFAEAVMHLEQDRLTCLIDALDECPEAEIREMIGFFEELGESAADKRIELRVCFSSRHYPHVSMGKCQDMLLDGQPGHDEDITKYVKSKLKVRNGKTGDDLRQAVQAKAQGVFLWVVLVVSILNKESDHGSNNTRLRRCLDQIPSELHKLFEDILQRGVRDDENLVPILQWVSFAQRPLACEELYFAVRSDRPDFDVSKPWDHDEDDTETMKLFILSSSKGLAELTRGKKPTVQFIHESVRDYLRETGFCVLSPDLHSSLVGSTHEYLKRCCSQWMADSVIEQLSLPQNLPKAKSQEAKELREKAATYFPFLEYSVDHLVHHAELAYSHGVSQATFVETFPLAQWTRMHNVLAVYNTRRYEFPRDTTMCILAHKGASHILEYQLTQGWRPTYDQCMRISRPAVTSGRIEILELILDNFAADVKVSIPFQELADLAINKGDALALGTIIFHGRNCSDVTYSSLLTAWESMRLDLVQVLLSPSRLGANEHWDALFPSYERSVIDDKPDLTQFLLIQVRALVEDDARFNAIVDRLIDCLSWKYHQHDRPIYRILVETELSANARSTKRRRAIVSACTRGSTHVLLRLLDHGYRIDTMNSASYFEALSGAARNGHADTLGTFLAHDPDIELQEADSYREVVQAVTMGRFGNVLKLLLDRSKGFRTQDRAIYRGPLRQAIQLGYHDIVQILRERGVRLPED